MKTPRHEQPWYESRLLNNKKPSPITQEERTILTEENRRLIEDAPKIIAWGIKQGWISYPEQNESRKWKLQGIQQLDDFSIDSIIQHQTTDAE
jgi:hypothetical protein